MPGREGRLVSWGYLNLSDHDIRKIPLPLPFELPRPVLYDSLSVASARAHSSTLPELTNEQLPFASFVDGRTYVGRRFEAGDVLAAFDARSLQYQHDTATKAQQELYRRINSQIVLVEASVHRDGPGRGPLEDVRETPAGLMPGYEIHANYIEAILDKRAALPANHSWLLGIKLLFYLGLTIVLISRLGDASKAGWLLLSLAILLAIDRRVRNAARDPLMSLAPGQTVSPGIFARLPTPRFTS